MDIFIDESGTHKTTDHSSIAFVYVEIASVELFEREVEQIEHKLEIKNFHWTNERWQKREEFLKRLLKLDFTFKVAVVKNPIRVPQKLEEALRHLLVERNIRKIAIDGQKPKWYAQRLKKVLRDKGVSVKKIITVKKDESSPGLRVADCLAGLTRYHFDNPNSQASTWFLAFEKAKKVTIEVITP